MITDYRMDADFIDLLEKKMQMNTDLTQSKF